LAGLVGEVESAWGGDLARFSEAVAAIDPVLACVNTPLDPALAARLLRLSGLESFVARDTVTAAATFSAARTVDPTLTLPEAWAPEGNPLRSVWATATPAAASVPTRKARVGAIYVDGSPSLAIPQDRPFVFQWIDGVRVSSALTTAANLPSYPRAAHPARNPLLLSGAIAALGAGALYGLAWSANADYQGATDYDELLAAQSATNGLTIAAASVGGVAVLAFGAGAVVAGVK
jgi:hypothetical protein